MPMRAQSVAFLIGGLMALGVVTPAWAGDFVFSTPPGWADQPLPVGEGRVHVLRI